MKDIEKNLKNRFQSQSIPVDKNESEELWAGISKGISPQPVNWYSGLNFTKIFLAIGVCTIMTFSLYYVIKLNTNATTSDTEMQNEKITQPEYSAATKNDLKSVTGNLTESNTDKPKEPSSDLQKDINSLEKASTGSIDQNITSKFINEDLIHSNPSNGVRVSSSDFISKVNSQKGFQLNQDRNAFQSITNQSTAIKNEFGSNSNAGIKSDDKLNGDFLRNGTSSFQTLSLLPNQLLPFSAKENFNERIKSSKEIELKNSSRWSVEVFGGTNIKIFDYHSTANRELADLKNNTDKIFLGYQFGINLGYQLNPNTILQTGINHQRSWSKLNHEFMNSETIQKRDQLIKVWIDANTLDTLNVQRVDTTVNLTSRHKVVHFNKYEKLSIPLLLGFQKNLNRFSVVLFVGPTFNFYTDQVGKHIDDEGSLSIFSNDEDPIFKKFQLGASAKLGLYYHWNDKLDLFVSPQFSFESNNGLFDDAFGLRTYHLEGNVGVRYRL